MVVGGRRIHPNASTKIRPGAKYVSKGLREYYLEQEGPFWYIRIYNGGLLHRNLKQAFTSHNKAEAALIAYLKQTDKGDRAIYPGSKNAPVSCE